MTTHIKTNQNHNEILPIKIGTVAPAYIPSYLEAKAASTLKLMSWRIVWATQQDMSQKTNTYINFISNSGCSKM